MFTISTAHKALLRGDQSPLIHDGDSFIYREHKRSHATLTVYNCEIPTAIMHGLYQSRRSRNTIVKICFNCLINGQNSLVLRTNCNEHLHILMKVERTNLKSQLKRCEHDRSDVWEDQWDDEVPF
jgi:hypothetical protein